MIGPNTRRLHAQIEAREANAETDKNAAEAWCLKASTQIEQAIEWCTTHGGEPMVAVGALRRFLRDHPAPRSPSR